MFACPRKVLSIHVYRHHLCINVNSAICMVQLFSTVVTPPGQLHFKPRERGVSEEKIILYYMGGSDKST